MSHHKFPIIKISETISSLKTGFIIFACNLGSPSACIGLHNNYPLFLFFTSGFDVYKSSNLKAVRDYIKFVDEKFKLVMFTEYFDESLVLLRRTMNWSMAGMISM